MDNNVKRFLLTFFLGPIGSIIINRTELKPEGYSSRSWCYLLLGVITSGIYSLVASICNFTFDPNKEKNIGYVRDAAPAAAPAA
ncbi:MAG: hypothetical protein J6Q06_03995, partial [Clostridia bacterium]|nr:hypothetical protein [Clostridia bacterium]